MLGCNFTVSACRLALKRLGSLSVTRADCQLEKARSGRSSSGQRQGHCVKQWQVFVWQVFVALVLKVVAHQE